MKDVLTNPAYQELPTPSNISAYPTIIDIVEAIAETEEEKIALAKQCVEIYDTPEEFYEKTKWDKDNPEQSSFQYLEENKICRKIQEKIWYFSRIRWEEGLKKLEN